MAILDKSMRKNIFLSKLFLRTIVVLITFFLFGCPPTPTPPKINPDEVLAELGNVPIPETVNDTKKFPIQLPLIVKNVNIDWRTSDSTYIQIKTDGKTDVKRGATDVLIKITAFFYLEDKTYSKEFNVTVEKSSAQFNTPTNFVATSGDTEIDLSWDNVSAATGYEVYQNIEDSSATAIVKGTPATNNYTAESLINGTKYFFWVKAIKGTEKSEFSTATSATPIAITKNLVATAGFSKVSLSWSATIGAIEYEVYQNTINDSSTASKIASSTLTQYIATGLTNQTEYFFWIKTVIAGGLIGKFSSVASAIPDLDTPLSPVATLGSDEASIDLSWQAVPDATGYAIFQGTTNNSANAIKIADFTTNIFNVNTGITIDTLYYFWIKATVLSYSSNFSQNCSITYTNPLNEEVTIGANTYVTQHYMNLKKKSVADVGLTNIIGTGGTLNTTDGWNVALTNTPSSDGKQPSIKSQINLPALTADTKYIEVSVVKSTAGAPSTAVLLISNSKLYEIVHQTDWNSNYWNTIGNTVDWTTPISDTDKLFDAQPSGKVDTNKHTFGIEFISTSEVNFYRDRVKVNGPTTSGSYILSTNADSKIQVVQKGTTNGAGQTVKIDYVKVFKTKP